MPANRVSSTTTGKVATTGTTMLVEDGGSSGEDVKLRKGKLTKLIGRAPTSQLGNLLGEFVKVNFSWQFITVEGRL